MEKLVTSVKEASSNLGLSEPTIYRLINKGKLTKIKVGRRTLITLESQRTLVGMGA